MSALTKHEDQAPASPASAFISMIERAAVNPDVDIEKMERLYAMHEKMQEREAKRAYMAALAEMQPTLPIIEHTKQIGYKDKSGKDVVKGTYTPWEDISEKIRPILAEHGFAISFRTEKVGDLHRITAVLSHRDGHAEETSMDLLPDPSGNKNAVQAIGSAWTYAKRYTASAILNLTTRSADGEGDDDDGETAQQPFNASQAKKHELWEKLTSDFETKVASRQEGRGWLDVQKASNQDYARMPIPWRKMFYNEFFLPALEKLPEVA